jgi:hypothetical protein
VCVCMSVSVCVSVVCVCMSVSVCVSVCLLLLLELLARSDFGAR